MIGPKQLGSCLTLTHTTGYFSAHFKHNCALAPKQPSHFVLQTADARNMWHPLVGILHERTSLCVAFPRRARSITGSSAQPNPIDGAQAWGPCEQRSAAKQGEPARVSRRELNSSATAGFLQTSCQAANSCLQNKLQRHALLVVRCLAAVLSQFQLGSHNFEYKGCTMQGFAPSMSSDNCFGAGPRLS